MVTFADRPQQVTLRSRLGDATSQFLDSPRTRAGIMIAAVGLVIGLLAWPMLFTSSSLGGDWGLHLWYVWQQGLAIEANHRPSLFLDLDRAAFYPLFAFYGGTLYALVGTLSALLGGATIAAYILSYLLAFAAAYGGWYWLGRMAGLGRWAAQVPGLVFITSGYYLTDIYSRGDWPELIAISTVPMLVASGLFVLVAQRLTLLPGIALAASALVFFGAHNITMLWGCSILGVLAVATMVAVPQARRLVTRRGLLRVSCVLVPAALVNAWYLLPALVYGRRTNIVQTYGYAHSLRRTDALVAARHLFTFSRADASSEAASHAFITALPVLAIAWTIVGIAISLRCKGGGAWRRVLWIFAGAAIAVGLLMTHPGLVLALPAPYVLVQFGFRLETWVLLSLSAALLALLVIARHWPRGWRTYSWAAIAVVIASMIGAAQQVERYPRAPARAPISADFRYIYPKAPHGEELFDYDDASLPLVNPADAPEVDFPSSAIHNEEATVAVSLPAGRLVRTNLVGAPYLVSVQGANVVGRAADGRIVLRTGSGSAYTHRISIRPADSLPIVLGRLMSILALLWLLALAFVCSLLAHRRRRGHRLGEEARSPVGG